eukprot:m.69360 g.69360  ORF g.69360 m.69360 type:complete len:413 (+) comp19979_c0_seq2:128-1366(+)
MPPFNLFDLRKDIGEARREAKAKGKSRGKHTPKVYQKPRTHTTRALVDVSSPTFVVHHIHTFQPRFKSSSPSSILLSQLDAEAKDVVEVEEDDMFTIVCKACSRTLTHKHYQSARQLKRHVCSDCTQKAQEEKLKASAASSSPSPSSRRFRTVRMPKTKSKTKNKRKNNGASSSSSSSGVIVRGKLPIAPNAQQTRISTGTKWFPETSSRTPAQIVAAARDVTPKTTEKDTCCVCMGEFDQEDRAILLDKCPDSHYFHAECIEKSLEYSARCPCCLYFYGQVCGHQPPGTMSISWAPRTQIRLAGISADVLVISYSFPSGTRNGVSFCGTSRTAYLPDTPEGRRVQHLLMKGFDARVLFTVGRSITTGMDNCVVWAGIHHKTSPSGGATNFGYPDPTYLDRVTEELASAGVR